MSAVARRRRRGLFGTIIADPYRKLAAIALAIGLWYFLNSKLEGTADVELRLWTEGLVRGTASNEIRVQLGNPNIVGLRFEADGWDEENATVRFRGPRALVEGLESENVEFRVPLEREDWSRRTDIEFDVKHLVLVRPERLRAADYSIELSPPRIRLHVGQRISETLPIDIDRVDLRVDVGEDDAKRLQRDKARFSSQTAQIWGPAASIRAFRQEVESGARKPFYAVIGSVRDDGFVQAVLDINAPPERRLKIEPSVSMTIPVTSHIDPFEVEIPLQIDDAALPEDQRGRYEVVDYRDYWTVTILASGELRTRMINLSATETGLDDFAKNYLRLDVLLSPADAGKPELTKEATLVLKGPMRDSVGPDQYSLQTTPSITLKRKE